MSLTEWNPPTATSDLAGRSADDAGPASIIGPTKSNAGIPALDAAPFRQVVTRYSFDPRQFKVDTGVLSDVVGRFRLVVTRYKFDSGQFKVDAGVPSEVVRRF